MDLETARKILDANPPDYQQKQHVLRGLQILGRYDDDLDCSFAHDQMYTATFDETIIQMTEEEIQEMGQCGWFKAYDSWSHF